MREFLEDLIDLILETTSEHLISFVEDEELKVFSRKESLLDHFEDTSGSSNDDLDTFSESLLIFFRVGTTCASISGDLQVLTEVKDDLNDKAKAKLLIAFSPKIILFCIDNF